MPPAERFLNRFPALRGHPLLLFLSRIDPKKGLELLLPAFAQLHAAFPEARLVIAGNGEEGYTETLQRMARALGVAEQVVWTGYLAGEEKLAALAAAEFFVLPSYSENFGIAVVEAMAAGLPVVISDQVGIHHEVSQAGAGRVVPCNSDALADALAELLGDEALRKAMGQRAQALATTHFSLATMAERLVGMYEGVAGQTRRV